MEDQFKKVSVLQEENIFAMNKTTMQRRYEYDKEAIKFYNSTAWETCRHIRLKKDYYLCQDCLKNKTITVYDVVHHIKPYKDHPELALDIENLISLCHSCHGQAERNTPGVGRKINIVEFEGNQEIF